MEPEDRRDSLGPPPARQPGGPTAGVCYCEEGELCRHCLGYKSGLLVCVVGGDPDARRPEEGQCGSGCCRCAAFEVCRHCLGPTLADKVLVKLSRPWRDAPEDVRRLATPLSWLEVMAERN